MKLLFRNDLAMVLGGDYLSSFFNIFYIIAFLAVTAILILEGIKRKIPLVSWLIVLAFSRLFFIIGTKVNSYGPSEWILFFQNLALPEAEGKVLLGGVLLGLISFIIGIKLFKIPFSSIDSFAFAFPVGLALQRFGCLLLGCCYGTPTALPWGVKYGFDSPPHAHYFNLQIIEGLNSPTPSLHPFQFYEIINGIVVILVLVYLKRKIKKPGNLFLISLSTWALIRLFTEFFRDPSAHAMGGTLVYGLKTMQWVLLFISILTTLIIIYRERKTEHLNLLTKSYYPSFFTAVIFLGMTVVMTWSLRFWMSFAEMLAMNLMLFPSMALASVHYFKENTVPQFRWGVIASMVLPIFLMSQTWNILPEDSTQVKSYDFIKGGYSSGDYFSTSVYKGSSGGNSGCANNYQYSAFESTYSTGGLGIGRAKISDNGILTYGINLSYGQLTEKKLDADPISSKSKTLFSVNPYVKKDWKWVGLGAGLHLGSIGWNAFTEKEVERPDPSTLIVNTPVFIQSYMRIGPERILFIDGGVSNSLPSPFPGMRFEGAIGSGFGLPAGNKFRIGTSDLGTFIQAQAIIERKYLFNLTYQFSDVTNGGYPGYNNPRNSQVLLNFEYRFNFRK